MNGYEKLIKTIRSEGSRDNPMSLVLGEVVSGISSGLKVKIGNLTYEDDDLLVAEHLTDKIYKLVQTSHNTSGQNVVKYFEPLQKGDQVVCYQISSETYVILEKVVSVNVSF